MPRPRRPFDIVHVAQTQFPDDPRPRREAAVATEAAERVAVVVLQDGRDPRPVGHFGRVVVIRLPGRRQRGSIGKYLLEYTDFLVRVHALFRRDSRFRDARVVHVHSLPDFLIAGVRPARRRGARAILDLHEIFPEFTRSKFRGVAGAIAERVARWLERWSRRQADVTLTVNRTIARLLAGRRAHRNERIEIIHNLSDPADFGPRRDPDGTIASPLRLVYHGTLTRMYGLDLAVAAVADARANGLAVELDLYGDGPDVPALTAQVARLDLTGSVRLPGRVAHHTLRSLLPTYHAGLVTTRLNVMTRYSLSTKLLEYVHLGIPLIAPRIPTYLEYFPEECAWYFAPNDADDAARAICAFASSPLSERMARPRAAQRAADGLRWADDAARLKTLYEELLGATRSDRQ
jgi:glycosyltransferase involved in cell wall biosynthesis